MQTRALLLRGHQGTGKSTLGTELSRGYGMLHLAKDGIYIPALAEVGDHHLASRIAYQSMRSLVIANRSSGFNFVIDAPFHEQADVEAWVREFQDHGVVARSVLLACSDQTVWDQRLRDRDHHPSPNHLITNLETLQSVRGNLNEIHMPGEPVFDTTLPENTPQLLAKLSFEHIMRTDIS